MPDVLGKQLTRLTDIIISLSDAELIVTQTSAETRTQLGKSDTRQTRQTNLTFTDRRWFPTKHTVVCSVVKVLGNNVCVYLVFDVTVVLSRDSTVSFGKRNNVIQNFRAESVLNFTRSMIERSMGKRDVARI